MSVKSTTHDSELECFAQARRALATSPGFGDCSTASVAALIAQGQLRRLCRNEALTRGGSVFDFMSIILKGSLEASVMRHDGHRHLIYFVQPGEVSGLIGVVDEGPHLYDMRAIIADTLIFLVPGHVIRELADKDLSLSRALARNLAFRSRLLHERLVSDPSLSLEVRVGKLLNTLARLHGVAEGEGMRIEMRIAQSDMADWLGVSRQRVNFAIQRLRQNGLIEHRKSFFHILDQRGLQALTQL